MSSNNNQLPLTVQDDIEAKERYSSKQRASNYCNSRRIRLWTLLFCAFLSTFALLKYSGIDYNKYSSAIVAEDEVIVGKLSLKDEIMKDIKSNPLIVYSKTYCPYILNVSS